MAKAAKAAKTGRTASTAVVALACALAAQAAAALPSFDEIKASYRPSDAVLLDRRGEPLQIVRVDASQRRLAWVPLADVSPALRTALLLSEDKRFYEHSGVDWRAVGAAGFGNLWNTRTRGASTLTMQLAGLIDDDVAMRAGGRSVGAKVSQAVTALRLERSWRKDQILEAYLNLVGFRGEVVGIGAMSAQLFYKLPSGLDAHEAAIAAALLRAPNAKAEAVARRACALLREQQLDCKGVDIAAEQAFSHKTLPRLDSDVQIAPHLARLLLKKDGPSEQRSTVEAPLQRFARDTLRRHLAELSGRQVEDGALVVIDNASGDVLAWVGGSGELSRASDVDAVLARRQPGSALKPFLYELAIEQRWLTAASLLDDSPLGLDTAAGLYVPQNYDHQFKGAVSVRAALASSLNIPAVRTLVMVTPERFHDRLQALGLKLRESGGYYGYSLALGSAEVTLADLANAYRALANGGRMSPLRLKPDDPRVASRAAMDARASYIVSDILADREARAATFGLDNALGTRRWSAVKTGTSKDMRDNWCLGYSGRYTVGVWVGNASGAPMADVSGVSGAAPVWRAVMDELMRRDALVAQPMALPAGLVHQRVRFEPALEPPREEWFVEGTQQSRIALAPVSSSGSLIAQPLDGSVFALDPDIPPQAQRVVFQSRGVSGARWRLDGKALSGSGSAYWLPWPGKHRLELLDAAGRVREAVQFEVRGARVKAAALTSALSRKREREQGEASLARVRGEGRGEGSIAGTTPRSAPH